MHEQWNLMVRARSVWVADNESPEQSPIHVSLYVMGVVMKTPGAYRLWQNVENICPKLPGKDLIAASTFSTRHSEWPRAIRVDTVAQSVDVKTVAVIWIAIQYMDVEALSGARIQH